MIKEELVEAIENNYEINVHEIKPNSLQGFLGDTYEINGKYIIKIPRRGGITSNPQGNVKFSAYIMNEANLHGIPCPSNVITKQGILHAYDKKLGYFHMMDKITIDNCSENLSSKKGLAFLMGFHSSQISLLLSSLKVRHLFVESDYIDHWSISASYKKMLQLFGINENKDEKEIEERFRQVLLNLKSISYIPDTLLEQIELGEPLELIRSAEKIITRLEKSKYRKIIIHNDIKPENLSFGINATNKRLEIKASFDYTMSCYSNPAKNIAYTVVDSFIGLKNDKIDYFEIMEVAKGVLYGFHITNEEIMTIEDEIMSACLKKYVMRWEMWEKELCGKEREYEINFRDPRDIYNMFCVYKDAFKKESLNNQIMKLSTVYKPNNTQIDKIKTFMNSELYNQLRRTQSYKLKQIINSYYDEMLEDIYQNIN